MFLKDFFKSIYIKYMQAVWQRRQQKYLLDSVKILIKKNELSATNAMVQKANRHRVLEYFKKHDGTEYSKELEFLKSNYPTWMQCSFELDAYKEEIRDEIEKIAYDEQKGMYYAMRNQRKLYFKKSMSKAEVINYYLITSFEQTNSSAHCYTNEQFNVDKNSVVFDVGAAEGLFAIDVIDVAKKIYLFECDEEWIDALKCTFAGYDNVEIIKKYVSDNNKENNICLDSLLEKIHGENLFIKMDIEGAEIAAIKGARNIIESVDKLKLAVCAYHGQDDYENLCKLLSALELSKTDGYLCPLFGQIRSPYFRVGVLRAKRD